MSGIFQPNSKYLHVGIAQSSLNFLLELAMQLQSVYLNFAGGPVTEMNVYVTQNYRSAVSNFL